MNTSVNNRVELITVLMNKGFERAADSFSRVINCRVSSYGATTEILPYDNSFSHIVKKTGDLCVLTTQLIGGVRGKCYLILSNKDCQTIYQSSFPKGDINQEIQDGLLMELDNIISASVISELVNAMDVELYGDVPQLKRMTADSLTSFLGTSYLAEDPSIIVSHTTFSISGIDTIHPQFVWTLSSRIVEMISDGIKTIL